MSRVGKQQLVLPANTELSLADTTVTVKGPLGTLSKVYNPKLITIKEDAGTITFEPINQDPETRAL